MLKKLTCFGEDKTVSEWSRDERCLVGYHTLRLRIKEGWKLQKALTYISNKANEDYLTGKKFGRLTVLGFSGKKTKRFERIWDCQCDCGNFKQVKTSGLVNLKTKSCGCYRKELSREKFSHNYLGYAVSTKNYLFYTYRKEAERRGLEWKLDKESFLLITKQKCKYCDCPPSKEFSKGTEDIYLYNGIDRVDSSKGYTIENSVPCCEQCNIMKFDYILEDFLNKIKMIYEFNNLDKK